nr:retrotransposon protein [Tanacetum cinerariifolium]
MQSQRAITIVKPSLLPTPPTTVNPSGKPLAIKWISPAKRQERLSKGLCFNCDNKWVRGHKCPVLEKMKLPITTMKQFKVYIRSDETLLCENLCSRVKLDIQGLSMEVDLYVLSMKGSDIMLRIQWLQKLGNVTHEYLQQTMEFILGETQYTLQGDESLRIKQISLRHM